MPNQPKKPSTNLAEQHYLLLKATQKSKFQVNFIK
ncbi:hypothetical protein PRO82_002120 [Candidatus Protochlamydia amoebophila]|nr:hypothetical protein [Candidatus Protochlamydia amoebophila]